MKTILSLTQAKSSQGSKSAQSCSGFEEPSKELSQEGSTAEHFIDALTCSLLPIPVNEWSQSSLTLSTRAGYLLAADSLSYLFPFQGLNRAKKGFRGFSL